MSIRSLVLLFTMCGAAASPAFATTYVVQESGVYDINSPTSLISAPNATYSFSFQIDSNPTPWLSFPGYGFYYNLTNFTYKLNGETVDVGLPRVGFFASYGGAQTMTIENLPGNDLLAIYTSQLYTGPESSPTILPGDYSVQGVAGHIGNNIDDEIPGDLIIGTGATPEPASLALVATGLAGAVSLRRRRAA